MDMLRLQPPSGSSSNGAMDKAKHIWSMLDELASSDPTTYKSFIEKTLTEGKEWMAPPTPYLAVRTILLSNSNAKIFYLNVFTWSRLTAPIKSGDLTKIYSLPPTQTTYNNEPCFVVNIAVHPDVLKTISQTQLIRSTFDLIVSQHSLLLDYNQYRILDEKTVGNLEEIQKNFVKPLSKKKANDVDENVEQLLGSGLSPSLVKQLSSLTVTDSSSLSSSSKEQQHPKKNVKAPVLIEELWTTPTFTEEITSNNNFLIIRISLPGCESVADCDVTVLPHEDIVQIECVKLQMRLKLDMQKRKKPNVGGSTFDIQRLTAKFVRKTQQLVLTVPIIIETTN